MRQFQKKAFELCRSAELWILITVGLYFETLGRKTDVDEVTVSFSAGACRVVEPE